MSQPFSDKKRKSRAVRPSFSNVVTLVERGEEGGERERGAGVKK